MSTSGWVLQSVAAINDSGQVIGYGTIGGQTHGFLLDLTTLTPSSATAGAAAFTLTVTGIGTNFVPGATVNWNGTALATTYVSATEVTASVPASLIAVAGTALVTVTTNEGTLAGGTFTIHPPRRLGLPGEPERRRQPAPREQQ
jgi:probable HAF family extracellular repeat protein